MLVTCPKNSKLNFNPAGPGRQPGYFLYWSKEDGPVKTQVANFANERPQL